MNRAKILVLTIEHLINNKTKQHIVGGLLFSVSVFLGALATTVLTMKVDPNNENPQLEQLDDNEEDEFEDDEEDEEVDRRYY